MTAARRRYSPTVDRLTPIVTAICRSLTPSACLNLRTSRTFRIGALSAGIGPPLAWPQRAPRPRFDRRQRELQATPTRVAGFDRKGWLTSVGIGGRIASESLAALRRITHQHAPTRAWRNSGGKDKYVGEWHTHLLGGQQPSSVDKETWRELVSATKRTMIFVIIAPEGWALFRCQQRFVWQPIRLLFL